MTIIKQLQYTTAESKQCYNTTMGENIENTAKTIDSQEQTPFDSLVNEPETREDDRIKKVLYEIELYIQRQLFSAIDNYESPEDIEEYESMLRELASSSPDDDNIWTQTQKDFERELFDLVQQLESLKRDQPQINPDNEEAQEPKSHIEIINEQIEKCIQEELDYAKNKHKSPDDERKYEQMLRKLANSRSGDAKWTSWAKAFHPELFKLVVKKEIELYIQTELFSKRDYYESPEDIDEYEDMLRELANSSPDDDVWTPKQKEFHRELFGLIQQLAN